MRKRKMKLSVYLNADEWRMLILKTKKVGYNKSALVRSLIEGFEPKESPLREFYEELNSIRKVGNVLIKLQEERIIKSILKKKNF